MYRKEESRERQIGTEEGDGGGVSRGHSIRLCVLCSAYRSGLTDALLEEFRWENISKVTC